MTANVILKEVQAFLDQPSQLFIGGQWQDAKSKQTFTIENPATEQSLAVVAKGNADDVDLAVEAAQQAFKTWRYEAPVVRAKLLNKLADLIEQKAEELAQIITLENGKPLLYSRRECLGAINLLRYFAGFATKIEGRTVPVSTAPTANFLNYTLRDPVGVCALIVPWNFPLTMCVGKLAPAMAVGCTTILKPADQTPLIAIRLMQLFEEAGFPKGVVNLVTGSGRDVGEPLSSHMKVNKVTFTGSTDVGKSIAQQATSNMKRVTLELGGKSPNIILPDADIDKAVAGAASAIFYNQGQVCTAGSRLYVHESILDEVLEKLKIAAQSMTITNGLDESSTMGPLVSKRQYETVMRYIERAQEDGAELIIGGQRPEGLEKGYYVQPTIFLDKDEKTCIAKEEIFGPVLTVMPWTDIDDLVERANNSVYGLAAGIWTKDLANAHTIAARLEAGSVWINCYNVVDPVSPFGGYKQSGWGREMSHDVIEAYTETKNVCVNLV
ncbi:aldehyde dehydrogenase family protein [Acinetobacter gerneri]|jgi:phenylacetaldehyde dehydrogenase|uniref:aldehyde dehydrogenase family protein n=1 Tax=Acinetobacter gerneri TaxID=202952 RepID=UPI0023F19EDC|nr:aldehyde dehydrogenase family protein [Acinetobacter gerneri]MCH4243365.1 aldehyde dehydrogenase family protein [Acinetobacter gerneri]